MSGRIDVSRYTAHTGPGRFEGETAATEYYHERMLDGDGETLYADGDVVDCETSADLFQIDGDEAHAFRLVAGQWFLLRVDGQGFAYGTVHATREAAERRFYQWAGV